MNILITPKAAASDAILEVLLNWSAGGLLDPFCWWEIPQVSPSEGLIAPDVQVIDNGVATHETLASAIARKARASARLIGFYPATASEPFDAAFAATLDHALVAASDVLAFEPGKPMDCHLVVVPSVIGQSVPPELFRLSWGSNVYVAPEDRADPASPNMLAEDADDFAAHAAHAAVVLCGLWRGEACGIWAGAGESQGPVDPLAELQRMQKVRGDSAVVSVVRSFSRVLDLNHLPDRLAHAVFMPGGDWPSPSLERFERLPAASAGPLVEELAERFTQRHADVLSVRAVEEATADQMRLKDWWAALRYLFFTVLEWVRRAPGRYVRQKVAIAEEAARKQYERIVSRFDEDSRQKVIGDDVEAHSGHPGMAHDTPSELLVADPPVRKVWSDLYATAFALTDGGHMPAGGDDEELLTRQSGGTVRRVVVTDPLAIAPDPALTAPHSVAPATSPRAVASATTASAMNAEAAAAAIGVEAMEDEVPTRPADAPSAPTPADRFAAASFVALVGEHLASQIATAEEQSVVPAPDGGGPADDTAGGPQGESATTADADATKSSLPGRALRAVGRVLRTFALFWIGIGLIVVSAFVPGGGWLLLFGVLSLVVGVVLIPGRFIVRALRSLRIEKQKALDLQMKQRFYEERAAVREGDAVALRRRLAEFSDWAEIVGWLVHHPWTSVLGDETGEGATPATAVGFPAACRVAARAEADLPVALVDAARSATFAPGWLRDTYDSVASSIVRERYRPPDTGNASEEVEESSILAMIAADTSEDPESPRRVLLQALRSERRSIALAPALRDRFGDYLQRAPLGALASPLIQATAIPAVPDPIRGDLTLAQFLAAIGDGDGTAFLMQHWSSPDGDENLVAAAVPAQAPSPSTVADSGLSAMGVRVVLGAPCRVAFSHVDFAMPVVAGDLGSCAAAERASASSEIDAHARGVTLLGTPIDDE